MAEKKVGHGRGKVLSADGKSLLDTMNWQSRRGRRVRWSSGAFLADSSFVYRATLDDRGGAAVDP
jgi:hypothetical protein